MSKNQKRAARREKARIELQRRAQAEKRRKLLVRGGVTALVLVIFGVIGVVTWQQAQPDDQAGPANMLSGGALFVGVDGEPQIVETKGMALGAKATPTDPASIDAPARIVTYIDFQCEFCKAFEEGNAEQIKEMVATGKASLEVQPVAILGDYSVRAASAASCMAALQPESFFDMLTAMYEQQPTEGGPGFTNNEILDVWSDAGIKPSSELKDCVNATKYADWIELRTDAVTSDPDIQNPETGSFGTPTVFVNGARYQTTDLTDAAGFAKFVEEQSTKS